VILENGQYDANWPFIHMMPEQTVQASIDLGGKVLFPVHWGKFSLAAHPWNEPAIRVTTEAAKLNVNVTTPKIGEPIIIDSIYPSGKWWNF
jgi:L-ascorbate metabolism protein UlaG (beta-lactamase superfamily)